MPNVHPRRLLPFSRGSGGGGGGTDRASLWKPVDPKYALYGVRAPPLGTLVIKVLAARDLLARDRNGLSDPFPVLRYGKDRITGPTVEKCLNPVWASSGSSSTASASAKEASATGAGIGGEAALSVKVYESRAFGRERVEIVLWDRDRVGREYLGEVSLGVGEWWGSSETWEDGVPPVGLTDEKNAPVWHDLRSSKRISVKGAVLVQIGFIPASPSPSTSTTSASSTQSLLSSTISGSNGLSAAEKARIVDVLARVREEDDARRTSKEERVLLASPTEGVNTKPIDDASPIGNEGIHLTPVTGEDSSDSDSDSTISGEESDTEDEEDPSTVAETSTEDEAEGPAVKPHAHHHHHHHHHHGAEAERKPTQYFDADEVASPPPMEAEPPTPPAISTSPLPAIVVGPPSAGAAPPAQPPAKKGLSFPGFMKRTGSARSVTTVSDISALSEGLSSAAVSASEDAGAGAKEKKKRFSRKKKVALDAPGSGAVTPSEGALAEAGLVGTAVGVPEVKGKKKKGKGKSREEKLKRRGTKRDYQYQDDEELYGLVQIEIKGAEGLPRFKNMLKTGFDMDAFCVVSFGKKVFRTRVIRHSLNPVWDEKLFFPIRHTEAHWTVAFNIYDWDKMSSNDHVGDIMLPLAELVGSTIQPGENGLYPATSEGRLLGDDFSEHALKIEVSDKEREPATAPTLHIRAKFTPYSALRQQFLRTYLRQYDIDENGAFSYLEIFSMLDSLGSTLTKDTISSFFTRFGKTDADELTTDEVVLCLEAEIKKPEHEKKPLEEGVESGLTTPAMSGFEAVGGGNGGLDFGTPTEEPPELTDTSGNMATIEPGTHVVTNAETDTVVKAPAPQERKGSNGRPSPPSRTLSSGLEGSSEDSGSEKKVERVINIKECPLCRKPRMSSKAEIDIFTHMGICSSNDPRSVNRIVVGEYVTASQAQRKWMTKIISTATKGAYRLGADSANIIVQDRITGALQEERMSVAIRLGIRMMYRGGLANVAGGVESARVKRMLESLSVKQGIKFDSPASVREIAPFIAFHNLNMDEALDPVSSYKTFNEFFYRKLKADARPIDSPDDPSIVTSPADCRAMFFNTVDEATKIWIKGRDFTIERLLGDNFKSKATNYKNGALAIFRLAPQDYHRYHSPIDGVCGPQSHISGKYYTVNPMAIRSSLDIYGENVRLVMPIVNPELGEVMNVFVGAMLVGTINMTVKEGDQIKHGDETGYFAFGGSTIVCLFPPGSIQWDVDLVENSKKSIETLCLRPQRQNSNFTLLHLKALITMMPQLPNELLAEIVENGDLSPKDLATCCLVSKTMCHFAQAQLYRDIIIEVIAVKDVYRDFGQLIPKDETPAIPFDYDISLSRSSNRLVRSLQASRSRSLYTAGASLSFLEETDED
ncbi:phosphatidylserine decarboxylase [Pseudohyphozyma bogoriensis]|nr:phosphatidylserine decarboxylase [Pseudohyphozyma bogoriensis]